MKQIILFRLLICQRKCEHPEIWEEQLLRYKISHANANHEDISIFKQSDCSNLTLQHQLDLLSNIPNSHKWLWSLDDPSKQQVKFEQRFSLSSRYIAGSPRNRIINTVVKNGNPRIVSQSLRIMLRIYEDNINSQPSTSKRRKYAEKRARPAIDNKVICKYLGIDEDEAVSLSTNVSMSRNQSLYRYFVEKLFQLVHMACN